MNVVQRLLLFGSGRTAAPVAPTLLSATAISSMRIDLAWIDNASTETGYRIYRSTDGGLTFSELDTTAADATTYSDTACAGLTQYHYYVVAYNAVGESDPSNTANATTVAEIYIDYKNGNDTTGDGSLLTPYRTLTKALTVALAGQTIGVLGTLVADEIYYERSVPIATNNLTIKAVPGHSPWFDTSLLYAPGSFAKTAGRTNIYEVASTAFAVYGAWHGITELTSVANLDTCDATANSYTRTNGVGNLLYVNVGGGAPISTVAAIAGNALSTVTGTGLLMDGINVYRGGRFLLLNAINAVVRNCSFDTQRESAARAIIAVSAAGCSIVNVTISNCMNNLAYGIYVDANNAIVRDCTISECQYGVYLVNDHTGVVIADNIVHNIGQDGIAIDGAAIVSGNTVYDCDHACYAGYGPNGSETTFHHNVAYGTGLRDDWRGFLAEQVAGGMINIYHNTAYGFLDESSGHGVMVSTNGAVNLKNNIFNGNTVGIYKPPAYSPTLDMDYNAVDNNGIDYSGVVQAAHDVVSDPAMTNPAAYDFTLQALSPCRGAGTVIAGVSEQNPATIGRYEYAM